MEAIIEIAGFQYKVKENSKIKVSKLKGNIGDKVTLPVLILIPDSQPDKTTKEKLSIGAPYLKDVECEAKIIGTGKSPKKLLYKYKSKKRYRIKKSHRQLYTELLISSLKSHS